ncbi:sideroflexin-2 isoform X6 [Heterocephalus glaber]|uniref:Sideroflexin-2 isoform X6 n=1 Tax=Heterocephalus glaber TaxID=10181 RepID=A0AAX6RV71_HETGA|nr:sideroflexin-2 isoform X6 [Heterocephalus glaber]
MEGDLSGFNIDTPRWDQRSFLGRLKHFLSITDPRTILQPEQELDWAKAMVEQSRMGVMPPGTQVEQLLYAKKLYDSAFHPDTGEKMNMIGRMSFQVPGGMIITGFMLHFYSFPVDTALRTFGSTDGTLQGLSDLSRFTQTVPAVIFWQWVNQSFNALVNYTNRNAASPTSVRQMAFSYLTATTTAVATAVGMNMWTKPPPLPSECSRCPLSPTESSSLGVPLGALRCRGCCELCQYPNDATAVSRGRPSLLPSQLNQGREEPKAVDRASGLSL